MIMLPNTVEELTNMTKKEFDDLIKPYKDYTQGINLYGKKNTNPNNITIYNNLMKLSMEMRDEGLSFKNPTLTKEERTEKKEKVKKSKSGRLLEHYQDKNDRQEQIIKSVDDDDMWVRYQGYQVHKEMDFIREHDGEDFVFLKNKRIEGINRELFILEALKENGELVADYGGTEVKRIFQKNEFKSTCRIRYNSPLNMYIDEPEYLLVYILLEGKKLKVKTYRTAREASEDLDVNQQTVRQAYRDTESEGKIRCKLKGGYMYRFNYSLNKDNLFWDTEDNDYIIERNKRIMEAKGWLK